jgi:fucose 4-O-acetylase-like acetyltransferase
MYKDKEYFCIFAVEMDRKRIEYIDLAKGMCMLLVVLGHFQEKYGWVQFQELNFTVSYVRMPLYFFLSGIFFKTYDSFRYFLTKKINHLLVPYLVFLILGFLTFRNFPIWFLCSLFYSNLLFYGCMRLEMLCANRYVLPILCTVLSVVGFFLPGGQGCDNQLAEQVYYMETAMTCLGFYYAGYAIRNYSDVMRPDRKSAVLYDILIIVMCIGVVAFVGWYYDYADTGFRLNFYGYSIMGMYAAGLAGCAAVFVLAKRLNRIPYISFIGRYSIIVLLTHFPLIYYVGRLLPDEGLLAVVLVFLLEIPVILVGKRYFPYVFAQKELIPLDKAES